MIWIVAGTSESRQLIERIKDLDNFVGTTATTSGKEMINLDQVLNKPMNQEQMLEFIKEHRIHMIIDMTHPYAQLVSENVKQVSTLASIPYIRYIREKIQYNPNCIHLASYEEAYEFLKTIEGTVFFTTGSKNIGDFEKVKGDNRFIYRILPALESLEECKKHHVRLQDIIGVLGSFSVVYNQAMFKEYDAQYVLMKDSGAPGGTDEKIQACQGLGIQAVVIGREDEVGYDNLDDIERIIRESKRKTK